MSSAQAERSETGFLRSPPSDDGGVRDDWRSPESIGSAIEAVSHNGYEYPATESEEAALEHVERLMGGD